MTNQLTFNFNPNKCIDCYTCIQACYDYHGISNDIKALPVVKADKFAQFTQTFSVCLHCKNPICVFVCPEGNFQKRYDGIVIRNSGRCQLCMQCIEACPFGAIKWDPVTNQIHKCDFCLERLDQGLQPICVENCITGALTFVKIKNELQVANPLSNNEFHVPMMEYAMPSFGIDEKQTGIIFLRNGGYL